MNDDKPESIWKKSWKGPRLFLLWLALMIVTLVLFSIGVLISGKPFTEPSNFKMVLIAGVVTASLLFVLWLFLRWLCCWKNFRRFLFGLACLATLVALAYAEEDWRGWHAWNRFKHEWETKGEEFDYAGVIPPPVPDDQNFAMAPIWVESMKAVLGPTNSLLWFRNFVENGRTNFVDRLGMPLVADYADWPTNGAGDWQKAALTDLKLWQNYYRTLAARTNLFPVAPQPQTPARDVLLALSKYDSAIEELREASRRPYSRFPLYSDPERPFDTLLPHLATLKRCTQVLRLRAIAELQNGQSDKALDDVKLLLRLIDSIHTEPFLISHLVRIALLQLALQPIYEGLAEHKWSDAQLAELDGELAKLDFLADYELSMRGERACSIATVDHLRRTRDLGILEGPDETYAKFRSFFVRLVPSGWFYLNDLALARMCQYDLLPLADVQQQIVSPEVVRRANDAEVNFSKNASRITFIARMVYPTLSQAVKKFAYAQSSVDLARTAIVLERYRLAHGEYPESLDALAPQFMAKIPRDIINGQPLHYRRTAGGQFVLYSVGWNETDDGGVVVLYKGSSDRIDLIRGDWVWRYPAR